MEKRDFERWFNHAFWKTFKTPNFPIEIPKTSSERAVLIERVFHLIASSRYSPSIPETELVVNKGSGVARIVPVFQIEDYCVYYFCIKELESVLCGNRTANTFGGWSLGGSFRRQEVSEIENELTEYGRYSFNPNAWVQAFGEFNSLLFSQLDNGNFSHVLQFDLSNFYDSVRLDMLERWIREEADSEQGWVVTLLFYFLNHWNRRNTGLHAQVVGLPQDALADCSRILANYYLQKYDQFAESVCGQVGAMYFRYSDDQMILMNDPLKVEGLLLLLTRNLDRYNLRVNQKKVQLWVTPDLQSNRCRNIQSIFSNVGDNKDASKVLKFANLYLAIPLNDLRMTWNGGVPLLNRLVWANLESLPKDKYDAIVGRLTSEEFLELCSQDKISRIQLLNARQSTPIDLLNRLREIGGKSVHNAYHHKVLTYAKSIKDAGLVAFFEGRISSLEQQMTGREIS